MPILSLENRIIFLGMKAAHNDARKVTMRDGKKAAETVRKQEETKADAEFVRQAVLYRHGRAMSIAQESGVLCSLQQLVQAHSGEEHGYQLVIPFIDSSDNKANQKYDLDYSSKLSAWKMQTHLFDGIDHAFHPLKLQASLQPGLKIDTHLPRFLKRRNKKEYARTKGKLRQLFPIYTMTLINGQREVETSTDLLGVPITEIKAKNKVTIQISTNPYYPSITIMGAKNEGTFTLKDWKLAQRLLRNKKDQVGGIMGFRTGRDDIQDALVRALGNSQHDNFEQKQEQPKTLLSSSLPLLIEDN